MADGDGKKAGAGMILALVGGALLIPLRFADDLGRMFGAGRHVVSHADDAVRAGGHAADVAAEAGGAFRAIPEGAGAALTADGLQDAGGLVRAGAGGLTDAADDGLAVARSAADHVAHGVDLAQLIVDVPEGYQKLEAPLFSEVLGERAADYARLLLRGPAGELCVVGFPAGEPGIPSWYTGPIEGRGTARMQREEGGWQIIEQVDPSGARSERVMRYGALMVRTQLTVDGAGVLASAVQLGEYGAEVGLVQALNAQVLHAGLVVLERGQVKRGSVTVPGARPAVPNAPYCVPAGALASL